MDSVLAGFLGDDRRLAASAVAGAVGAVVLALLARRRPPFAPLPVPGRAFAWRALLVGLAATAAVHAAIVTWVARDAEAARSLYAVNAMWPLRVFAPRVGVVRWPDAAFLVLAVPVLVLFVARAARGSLGPWTLWAGSVALLVVLNASQGGPFLGLVDPVSNPQLKSQTFDDAQRVAEGGPALADFDEPETVRSWDSPHTKSHPFLVVTLFGLARRVGLGVSPVAILLLALASLAPPLAWYAFRRARAVSDATASRLAALLALTPAVNVYGATSVEGPLLTICLLAAVLFVEGTVRRSRWRIAASGAVFVVACLWSFGAIWVAAGLLGLGVAVERRYLVRWGARLADAVAFLAPVVATYVALRSQGYDYVGHLRLIARSGMGVHWLATPGVAVQSRLQNLGEWLLLGSPLLLGGWFHATARARRSRRSAVASLAASGVPLALLFAFTPIYSEFSRGWLFLAPFLLLPLAPFVARPASARWWIGAAAAWTWLWQAFGYHSW
jgi:hypothetical protein